MKTVMLNMHSKNNMQVFLLTVENHAEYAARHEWDALNLDRPYAPILDTGIIPALLADWDAVVMLGSDIWFTNMNIDVLTFAPADAAMTMAPDPCADIPANGDFMVFRRSPHLLGLLARIDALQRDPSLRFGWQDAVKAILAAGGHPGLHIAPVRTLQSFPRHNDILPPVRENAFWEAGDLCIHFIGGCNWKKCLDIVAFTKLGLVYNF